MIASLFLLATTVVTASAQSCTPRYGDHSVHDEPTAPDLFKVNLNVAGTSSPVVIQVNRTWSPVSADHFYALLRDGYYDCAAFTDIVPGGNGGSGYAQSGIAADPAYTSKWATFISDDDVTVAHQSNKQYTVAFIPDNGRGTRSTYFMIQLDNNTYLDTMGYYPFGQVVSGFDALTKFTSTAFAMSDTEKESYEEQGDSWLWTHYDSDSGVQVMSSMTVQGGFPSQGGGSPDRAGSWAFGIIMVLLSSAGCVYAGLFIYRYIRQQQAYDSAQVDDSRSGSSDRIVSLNLQDA